MSPESKWYQELIATVAARHGIGAPLLSAVVQTESSFRADGFRHEPQFWLRYMKPSTTYQHLNPRRYSSSYGLMQIMWTTAVEEGFDPTLPPEHLFVPETGLEYGCQHLVKCIAWAQQFQASEKDTLLSALCAYNGGRNSAQQPPNPRNIKYALKVWSHLQEFA